MALRVVAEGIEERGDVGNSSVISVAISPQGYFISRPMPAEQTGLPPRQSAGARRRRSVTPPFVRFSAPTKSRYVGPVTAHVLAMKRSAIVTTAKLPAPGSIGDSSNDHPDAVAFDLVGSWLVVHGRGTRGRAPSSSKPRPTAGATTPHRNAFRVPPKRSEIMFGPAGFLYVYLIYGMHWCMNIVTGAKWHGQRRSSCAPPNSSCHRRMVSKMKRSPYEVRAISRGTGHHGSRQRAGLLWRRRSAPHHSPSPCPTAGLSHGTVETNRYHRGTRSSFQIFLGRSRRGVQTAG